jgi:SAM-dependent methyltransferase
LPLPPLEMRELVGPTDAAAFDNPIGAPVYPYLADEQYEAVLDFGCGCGRVARQLIQQRPRPRRYLGLDLHRGMIEWCRTHLSPHAPEFEFVHHDVANRAFNPGSEKPDVAPFPATDSSFTLVQAWSVFTHLVEPHASYYLREAARVLRPGGVVQTTWFLFEKRDFPMMQDFQNALYINHVDPWNAVIFDREWVRRETAAAGLTIFSIIPPAIRGFHWVLLMAPADNDRDEAVFPPDDAPYGQAPPPVPQPGADRIGLVDGAA